MKVIVDDKIPYIKGRLEHLIEDVSYLPGSKILHEDVRYADVLIVRTRTKCNADLLHDTAVRLIITATIGFDHIDIAYCREAGIVWTNCPGCNANSVRWYVHNAVQALGCLNPFNTIGIVGVGHVGKLVARDMKQCGLRVLLCDPPRYEQEGNSAEEFFVNLSLIMAEADIITFHTPLTFEGKYSTYHLADRTFFQSLGKHPVIINASRGGVVDNNALLEAINEGLVSASVIDTWENEPQLNRDLLAKVDIATPHVAGYSTDGKANATRMVLKYVADFIGKSYVPDIVLPEAECLSVETLLDDSLKLKGTPDKFEDFRGNYPIRKEPII